MQYRWTAKWKGVHPLSVALRISLFNHSPIGCSVGKEHATSPPVVYYFSFSSCSIDGWQSELRFLSVCRPRNTFHRICHQISTMSCWWEENLQSFACVVTVLPVRITLFNFGFISAVAYIVGTWIRTFQIVSYQKILQPNGAISSVSI